MFSHQKDEAITKLPSPTFFNSKSSNNMKRRGFIKSFAAACVVPVVAAKAIASHNKKPKSTHFLDWMKAKDSCGATNMEKCLMDYKPTHAYSRRPLYSDGSAIPLDEHGNAYAPIMYDQSGNGNHMFHQ